LRIAVIGGGLFGCTAAIHLARDGHEVHLFERSHALMNTASAVNQFRLHRGYHYPRSPETGAECKDAENSFRAEYGNCVIDAQTVYAIAAHASRTSAVGYLNFLMQNGLPFHAASGAFSNALSIAIAVRESRIDPDKLREVVTGRVQCAAVHLNASATPMLKHEFDTIVIAAYAGSNDVAQALGCKPELFQFEVIEKPVLQLPKELRDLSIVVMDGEFCSLDPYGTTGLHVMGHVKHAIHHANTGTDPLMSKDIAKLLNRGVVLNPPITKIADFLEAGREFIPALRKAEHVGSMFTVRAVLPDRDATDARPTLVHRLDERVVRIFSGKLGTCVVAAQKTMEMIGTGRVVPDEWVGGAQEHWAAA